MRLRRGAAEWRGILQEVENSGLTGAAFCAKNGLSVKSLERWRRKLRDQVLVPARFVEVELPPSIVSRPMTPGKNDSPSDLVVELPYGVVLRFRGLGR